MRIVEGLRLTLFTSALDHPRMSLDPKSLVAAGMLVRGPSLARKSGTGAGVGSVFKEDRTDTS
jgi:hypothetical protein